LFKVDKKNIYLKSPEKMKGYFEEGLITKKVMEYHAKAFTEMNRKNEE